MWIGVECDVPYEVLEKWGIELERSGSHGGIEVGEFLRRCSRLLNGSEASNIGMRDRMLEIEMRAVENVERKRSDVLCKTGKIIGEIVKQEKLGVSVDNIMSGLGVNDWSGGRVGGEKNGGIKKSRELGVRRKRAYKGGGVVRSSKDGSVVSTVEHRGVTDNGDVKPGDIGDIGGVGDADVRPKKGGCAGVKATLQRDKRHAVSFKGWCAVQLRGMGFKMEHIARAIGEDKSHAWRIISGYERYWKRQRLAGVLPPEPSDEWKKELQNVIDIATMRTNGRRNSTISLNGTGKEDVSD